jgi:hypothetical protein
MSEIIAQAAASATMRARVLAPCTKLTRTTYLGRFRRDSGRLGVPEFV